MKDFVRCIKCGKNVEIIDVKSSLNGKNLKIYKDIFRANFVCKECQLVHAERC